MLYFEVILFCLWQCIWLLSSLLLSISSLLLVTQRGHLNPNSVWPFTSSTYHHLTIWVCQSQIYVPKSSLMDWLFLVCSLSLPGLSSQTSSVSLLLHLLIDLILNSKFTHQTFTEHSIYPGQSGVMKRTWALYSDLDLILGLLCQLGQVLQPESNLSQCLARGRHLVNVVVQAIPLLQPNGIPTL